MNHYRGLSIVLRSVAVLLVVYAMTIGLACILPGEILPHSRLPSFLQAMLQLGLALILAAGGGLLIWLGQRLSPFDSKEISGAKADPACEGAVEIAQWRRIGWVASAIFAIFAFGWGVLSGLSQLYMGTIPIVGWAISPATIALGVGLAWSFAAGFGAMAYQLRRDERVGLAGVGGTVIDGMAGAENARHAK